MDFYDIKERVVRKETLRKGILRKEVIEIYPDFKVGRTKDLMVRGGDFYAIWDEEKNLWSTDKYDVARLIDKELTEYKSKLEETTDATVTIKYMGNFSSNSWKDFNSYLKNISDNSTQLDTFLTFLNTEVKKKDHVSKRLLYPLEEGPCNAYDEILSTLYDPEERTKIEWAIGAIVAGEAKDIQKFVVIYGEAGAGKSTVLNIIQKLFDGYCAAFEARALTSSNNTFALEPFEDDPLVAIDHDGDLSHIEDNTRLNSVVSHEKMVINAKFKSVYTSKINSFLFIASNKPVKITDAKSGVIRRLIDVKTSGRKIPTNKYFNLMSQIDFELGAIAYKCLNVYRSMGKNYYAAYLPIDMMFKTDVFFNFVEENYHVFKEQDGVSLSQAYDMYKTYCNDALIEFKLPKYKFKDELKNYFAEFLDYKRVGEKQFRNYYFGFKVSKFTSGGSVIKDETVSWLDLSYTKSIFDEVCSSFSAQYANDKELPTKKWADVTTHLSDIDTTKLHYVLVPTNHIVIDFDLKDDNGEKSAERNLEAASKWPPTYAEYSKSQKGIHLHYIYEGDTNRLSSIYEDGIEVKIFRVGPIGPASLRRKLSKCNNIPITTINSGLPLKKEEKMINFEVVKSEKALRTLIIRNLHKEIHAGTKPSMDFIKTILDEAYNSGLKYDVTDMRPRILAFAANSTNQASYCIGLVGQMKFKSDEPSDEKIQYKDDKIVFYDVEVFPNLFVVSWKYQGPEYKCNHMINPTAQEIEELMKMKLVGFNNRKYDNHILYARYVGYDNQQLQVFSQRVIDGSRNAMFSEAYSVSYTDIYDFSSAANKMSLKKWQIKLGIHHKELGLPWDKPVPEELWEEVCNYCDNDVISEEAVFNYLSGDWVARQILADLSGLTVNDTTNQHSIKIIFGDNKHPQDQFVYTDLSEMFPGYKYEMGKSTYRGEDPGEGGYVYAEPGAYENVALLDIASMHPTSIEQLNLFGPYTKVFSEIKAARIAIKRNQRSSIEKLLDCRLCPFLERADRGEFTLSDLSTALKTVLNSVYGLTSAKFENPCRDPRNKDNIVAKRGALFMINLKYYVQEQGFTVAHIKTDSIKIPNATKEIIEFVTAYGKEYGYEFEHEATYEKMLLLNEAVYVAKYSKDHPKFPGQWTATGTQFQVPYVFKKLFSKEEIVFEDLCETKSVTTAMYLDMNEGLDENEHDYRFVGKVGSFCPIASGYGGGLLLRESDGGYHFVSGSKNYRWLEAEVVRTLGKENYIDLSYYDKLVDESIKDISKFTDVKTFIS